MVRIIDVFRQFGIRAVLWAIMWRGEMKYFTIGWLLMAVASTIVYVYVSPVVAVWMVVAGGLGLMYSVHTYWAYEQMRDDDDFEHNPKLGAIVGTTLMYIICLVVVVALFAVWGAISAATGYPLVLPGVIGTYIVYLLYRKYR